MTGYRLWFTLSNETTSRKRVCVMANGVLVDAETTARLTAAVEKLGTDFTAQAQTAQGVADDMLSQWRGESAERFGAAIEAWRGTIKDWQTALTQSGLLLSRAQGTFEQTSTSQSVAISQVMQRLDG